MHINARKKKCGHMCRNRYRQRHRRKEKSWSFEITKVTSLPLNPFVYILIELRKHRPNIVQFDPGASPLLFRPPCYFFRAGTRSTWSSRLIRKNFVLSKRAFHGYWRIKYNKKKIFVYTCWQTRDEWRLGRLSMMLVCFAHGYKGTY